MTRFTDFPSLALGAVFALVSGSFAAVDPDPFLDNGRLRIEFDQASGALVRFRDLQTGRDRLEREDRTRFPLWSVEGKAGEEVVAISSGEAGSFRWEKQPGNAIRLIWEDFGVAWAPELRAVATVRLEEDAPMSAWEFSLENPGPVVVREIRYPVVSKISPMEEERLAVPRWMGEEAANPRKLLAGSDGRGRRLQWSYPGNLSLQCLALYGRDGPGFYAACEDTDFHRKSFVFRVDAEGGAHFEIGHHREMAGQGAGRHALGYRVVLGTFQGDWLTAAERYRAWGIRQSWAQSSRLREGKTPAWVVDTGLWVWNRGRSPGVLPPASALQARLGLPVGVFWHWWHGCPYDTGFPEYFPPREGTDAFREALAKARSDGIRVMVYMNQRLWGMTTASWEEMGAAAFAVKGPDGAIRPEIYNIFTRQACASMCMGTGFWRDHYASLAERAIRELGVDAIYMDQACSSLECYDPTHGHPPGAGNYWIEGFRELAADIRQRSGAGEAPALAGEGCGEAWLRHLDLMLTLQVSRERYAAIGDGWEPIPMFHAVYHPCVILFGNYGSLTVPPYDDLWPAEHAPPRPLALLDRKFSGQFYLEQARTFVWGQQPAIANFSESLFRERPQEMDYILRLARLRRQAAKYLVHGTFLRPPSLDAPQVTLDFSRLSIYAGQSDRVRSFRKECPSVLAGAWLAETGEVGIALASIVDRPLEVCVRLDPADRRLPSGGRIELLTENGRSSLGVFDPENPSLTLELPPLGLCLLEVTAVSGADPPRQ